MAGEEGYDLEEVPDPEEVDDLEEVPETACQVPVPRIPLINPANYTPELCVDRVRRHLVDMPGVARINTHLPPKQLAKLRWLPGEW